MDIDAQLAMDGSPAVSEFFNSKNDPNAVHGPFGSVKWQLGPVGVYGVNGATIEDVIEVCIERLKGFQTSLFATRENALAITALEEGRNWLLQRTRDRQARGVEGRNER